MGCKANSPLCEFGYEKRLLLINLFMEGTPCYISTQFVPVEVEFLILICIIYAPISSGSVLLVIHTKPF